MGTSIIGIVNVMGKLQTMKTTVFLTNCAHRSLSTRNLQRAITRCVDSLLPKRVYLRFQPQATQRVDFSGRLLSTTSLDYRSVG